MSEHDPAILDASFLDELRASVDGDRGFVVELIEAYLSDGAAHVAAIDAAFRGDDAEALVRPAHTLKSSSATLGAMRLAGTARELEIIGRSGSLAEAGEPAGRVEEEWQATSDALRAWISSDNGA